MASELACPNCLAENRLQADGPTWSCKACGASFDSPLRLCATCGAANEARAGVCTSCGTPLGVFEQVMGRHRGSQTPDFLADARSQAQGLKEAEGEASQRRFGEFQAIDQRRQQYETGEMEKRRRSDRQLLILGLIFALLILAACVGLGILLT